MRNYNRLAVAVLSGSQAVLMGPNQGARSVQAVPAQTGLTADERAELEALRARNRELAEKVKQQESGLHNIAVDIKGTIMTLTVDLAKVEPTAGTVGKAGKELKTNRVATSHGNYSIEMPGGKQGYFSLNVGQYPNNRGK